jgi:hypothetical protein
MRKIFIWSVTGMMMMMMNSDILSKNFLSKLITLIFIFFCQNNPGSSQTKDFQFWSDIKLEAEIFNNISVEIEEEIRLVDNISRIEDYFTDVGISYNFWDNFTFAGYYRFVRRNESDGRISNIHRYYFDLEYEKKIRRYELSLRTRYQSRYKNINSDDLGYKPENHNRNKISLAYDIYRSPLRPQVWFEVYYQLNNPESNVIDKIRFAPELRYRINKHISVDLYYMIEKEYNVNNPETNFILGTSFQYKL